LRLKSPQYGRLPSGEPPGHRTGTTHSQPRRPAVRTHQSLTQRLIHGRPATWFPAL
jgi:hypothetical protein